MSKNQKPGGVYAEDAYVDVAREGAEEALPDRVPKSWLGTDLLEPGVVEFKGGGAKVVTIPEGEPTDKWTVPQLDLYAGEKKLDGYGDAKDKAAKLALVTEHYKAANPPQS